MTADSVVVDASALVELLKRSRGAPAIEAALSDTTVFAPAHVDSEVLSSLRRLERRGELDGDRGRRAVTDLAEFPLQRVPCHGLAHEAWELRQNVTAGDALYVVLARRLSAPLLTTDGRLSRAPGLGVTITLVSG